MPKSKAKIHVSDHSVKTVRRTATKTKKSSAKLKTPKQSIKSKGQKRCPGCGRFM